MTHDTENAVLREAMTGHEWRGGYYCQCGHLLNSPAGYLDHLARVISPAEPMRCQTRCGQHPNCQHDWSAWAPVLSQEEGP